MTFDSFIGNLKIVDRLRAKLRAERFPHGLIFSGPEGVGKHTCARMIAKGLVQQPQRADETERHGRRIIVTRR